MAVSEQMSKPFLVTIQADSLTYDKTRDCYTVTISNSTVLHPQNIIINDDDNADLEQSKFIKFEIQDASKVIHIEKYASSLPSPTSSSSSPKTQQQQQNGTFINRKDQVFLSFWAVYMLIAVVLFIFIEDLTFVDSLYFRVVTSFGVGFGDIVPKTTFGKCLNCIFICIDLMKLAYIDYRVMKLLFSYRRYKQRKEMMSNMSINDSHNNDNDVSLSSMDAQLTSKDPHSASTAAMTKLIDNRSFLYVTIAVFCTFFISGTLVIRMQESESNNDDGGGDNYSWTDAFVWNVVTLSQVGYGDVIPFTVAARIFTIFYIFFGYILILYIAVIVFDCMIEKYESKYASRNSNYGFNNDSIGGGSRQTRLEMTGLLSS